MSRRKSVEPLYKSADTVLCNFHGQLYDAIILETKHVDILEKEIALASESENTSGDPISIRSMSTENGAVCSDGFAYYLHYKNWNSSWDEWVRSDCLMAITEEARQRQLELKLAARKEKMRRSSKKRRRRVWRKSVPSSSQNDNLDEDLSEVGRVNETLESQEPMDISNFDDVCADEDELMNEGSEDRGMKQATGNLNDSTNANIETEINTLNINLSTDDSALHGDKSLKLENANKEKSLTDSNLLPPDNAGAEEKEMKSPEKIDAPENQVESTPPNLTTSNTSVEVKKQILAGVKSDDNSLTAESKTSVAAQDLGTATTNYHPLGEKEKVTLEPKGKEQNPNANTNQAEIVVEHPCSIIGTPTVNDVLPELRDYLCSINLIGNVLAATFVDKLGLMFENFCKKLVLPSMKYSAEQAMIKNGVSAFGSIVHFSGLLKLISVLEDREWSNVKYYKRLQVAEISYELEDLETIFYECKKFYEAAKTFLLSKQGYYPMNVDVKGSNSLKMEISNPSNAIQSGQMQSSADGTTSSDIYREPVQTLTENCTLERAVVLPDSEKTLKSSCDILLGEHPVECLSSKENGVMDQMDLDHDSTPAVTPQSQEKVDGETSNRSDIKMEDSKPQTEHSEYQILDKIPETAALAADASSSLETASLVEKSENKSVNVRGDGEQIPIHVSSKDYPEQKRQHSSKSKSQSSKSDPENVPARTMRTRRSIIEDKGKTSEDAMSDHSGTSQKSIRLTRQSKIDTSSEVASETTLNTPSFSSAGSSSMIPLSPANEAVVALLSVGRKRKSEAKSLKTSLPSSQNSPSSISDEVHEDPGVAGKRSYLRRKVVNYK